MVCGFRSPEALVSLQSHLVVRRSLVIFFFFFFLCSFLLVIFSTSFFCASVFFLFSFGVFSLVENVVDVFLDAFNFSADFLLKSCICICC
jgi:hypothetical protein